MEQRAKKLMEKYPVRRAYAIFYKTIDLYFSQDNDVDKLAYVLRNVLVGIPCRLVDVETGEILEET